MAASRALAAGVRCNACRTSVLRSFASLAGLDVSASGLSRARPTARAFSTAPLRLSDSRSRKAPAENEDDGELAPGANVPSDAQDASVPWYLKVDAPQRPLDTAAHPLADKQRIPALPEHSPPVLEPFLQYVSVDLGVDDLTLLDLRNLDPPPALGANLLMLFGTARSEKHLHVSADRLCRWLRSNYKLSPHADGLLGRNELKLKLRRKARKARMLSNAGASENSLAADDGIRTGWICVNVGSIKAADSAPVAVSEEASFVGFGGGSEGVSIVLQLFTEEKRAELDLEGLWSGVLKTDRRRKEAQSPGEDTEHTEDATNNPNGAVIADRTVAKHSSQLQHGNPQAPLQARAYHTTRARQHGTRLALARARETPWANSWSRAWRSSMSTLSDTGAPLLGKIAPSQLRDQAKPDQLSEAIGLASKLEQLYQMSRDEKLEALGKGSGRERKDLSPFLEEFYSYIPEFPDVVHWEAIMQLYLSAISENHPGYPLFLLHDVFQEMQIAGIRVPERMFLAGLRAILSREHSRETEEATARRRNQIVFALLYAMQGHSYPVITDDIIIMLHDSVSMLHSDLEAQHADAAVAEKRAAYHQAVRHELLHQMDMLAIPLKRDTYAHLLRSYAILGDMKGMWHVWRSTALAMLPRSAQMYAIALNGVAFTGNQVDCIKALRDCLAQMGQEIPPVSLRGDVREAVMRCLLVVEPDVEQSYEQGGRQGEWVKYWNECMRSLQREKAEKNSGSGRVLSNRDILGQFRTSKLSRA